MRKDIVDFYEGAYGSTIRFDIHEKENLILLIKLFEVAYMENA